MGDRFGGSMAISSDGTILVVGASGNYGIDSLGGQVIVYEWDGLTWVQKGNKINGDYGNSIGDHVSLSSDGNVVAISTIANLDTLGEVFVYEYIGNEWIPRGNSISAIQTFDHFGQAISLSDNGDILAIGAPIHNLLVGGDSLENAGLVQVYIWDGIGWSQLGDDLTCPFTNWRFGSSLSINSAGDMIAIGAPTSNINGPAKGLVRIYEWNGIEWEQEGDDIVGTVNYEVLGASVDISNNGSIVSIGSKLANTNSYRGQVKVFKKTFGIWSQMGDNILGKNEGDIFGWDVDLSADGNRLVVGSVYNDGNGENSGAVSVYDWKFGEWVQQGFDILGEDAGDFFGNEVVLSDDGKLFASGSSRNENFTGQVRVFNLEEGCICPQVFFDTIQGDCSEFVPKSFDNRFDLHSLNGQITSYFLDSNECINISLHDSLKLKHVISDLWMSNPEEITIWQYDDGSIVDGLCLTDSICLTPNEEKPDLRINITPEDVAQAGFEITYKVTFENIGSQTLSDTIFITYPNDVMEFSGSSQAVTGIIGNRLFWLYSGLEPFMKKAIFVEFALNGPMDTPPLKSGDIISLTAEISPTDGDYNPLNNEHIITDEIVNSFDPNDKKSFIGGYISPEDSGKEVTYKIRFENIGSSIARNIIITDMIDTSLFNLGSVSILSSSHLHRTEIIHENTLAFYFDDINLSFDTSSNDGYISFQLYLEEKLNNHDTILNSASIYFDHNFPIVTNVDTIFVREPLHVIIQGSSVICDGDTSFIGVFPEFADYLWTTGDTTPSISITSPGTYGITVSDGYGYTGTDVIEVVGLDIPLVKIEGDSVLCSGDTGLPMGRKGT